MQGELPAAEQWSASSNLTLDGEKKNRAVLFSDMTFLIKLWQSIEEKIKKAKPRQFIHKDLPLSERILRDLYKKEVERVRVDSKETYQRLTAFAGIFVPDPRLR